MESLNAVSRCHLKVSSVLSEPLELPAASPTNESTQDEHELLGDHSPTCWIDDPGLEHYAQTALDTKMLVIGSINFATYRICDVLDTALQSDISEELRELHDDLFGP